LFLENPEPDEALMEYMRQNAGDDVKEVMRRTVLQRRSVIRVNKELDKFPEILKKMPRLFDFNGMVSLFV
jgi:hypothetical protein